MTTCACAGPLASGRGRAPRRFSAVPSAWHQKRLQRRLLSSRDLLSGNDDDDDAAHFQHARTWVEPSDGDDAAFLIRCDAGRSIELMKRAGAAPACPWAGTPPRTRARTLRERPEERCPRALARREPRVRRTCCPEPRWGLRILLLV